MDSIVKMKQGDIWWFRLLMCGSAVLVQSIIFATFTDNILMSTFSHVYDF